MPSKSTRRQSPHSAACASLCMQSWSKLQRSEWQGQTIHRLYNCVQKTATFVCARLNIFTANWHFCHARVELLHYMQAQLAICSKSRKTSISVKDRSVNFLRHILYRSLNVVLLCSTFRKIKQNDSAGSVKRHELAHVIWFNSCSSLLSFHTKPFNAILNQENASLGGKSLAMKPKWQARTHQEC